MFSFITASFALLRASLGFFKDEPTLSAPLSATDPLATIVADDEDVTTLSAPPTRPKDQVTVSELSSPETTHPDDTRANHDALCVVASGSTPSLTTASPLSLRSDLTLSSELEPASYRPERQVHFNQVVECRTIRPEYAASSLLDEPQTNRATDPVDKTAASPLVTLERRPSFALFPPPSRDELEDNRVRFQPRSGMPTIQPSDLLPSLQALPHPPPLPKPPRPQSGLLVRNRSSVNLAEEMNALLTRTTRPGLHDDDDTADDEGTGEIEEETEAAKVVVRPRGLRRKPTLFF